MTKYKAISESGATAERNSKCDYTHGVFVHLSKCQRETLCPLGADCVGKPKFIGFSKSYESATKKSFMNCQYNNIIKYEIVKAETV